MCCLKNWFASRCATFENGTGDIHLPIPRIPLLRDDIRDRRRVREGGGGYERKGGKTNKQPSSGSHGHSPKYYCLPGLGGKD